MATEPSATIVARTSKRLRGMSGIIRGTRRAFEPPEIEELSILNQPPSLAHVLRQRGDIFVYLRAQSTSSPSESARDTRSATLNARTL